MLARIARIAKSKLYSTLKVSQVLSGSLKINKINR